MREVIIVDNPITIFYIAVLMVYVLAIFYLPVIIFVISLIWFIIKGWI